MYQEVEMAIFLFQYETGLIYLTWFYRYFRNNYAEVLIMFCFDFFSDGNHPLRVR